jgi:glycolate oxidase subunit GlcD
MSAAEAIRAELVGLVGLAHVAPADDMRLLQDATEARRLPARADAWVRPGTPQEVAAVMAWCYENEVPLTPRGGGTGLAGGAVPLEGGVLLSLDRLTSVFALEPQWWRMHVGAGLSTAHVRRLASENGLLFPPDPGAMEQSQIGGNVATNAGGPHAFKYGVTGRWVSGLEVVLPPGRVVTLGGPLRKDVAGLDLTSLMVGSEGTLGIVTAVWLRLTPAPAARLPVAAAYRDVAAGVAAIESVLASGVVPAAIEFLDAGALAAARDVLPLALPREVGFLVLAECDGDASAVEFERGEVTEALAAGAVALHSPSDRESIAELWRWRAGISAAVAAQRGGKLSEDIAVPLERLREAIEGVVEIGERLGIPSCSFGHAGDGNLHAAFAFDPGSEVELRVAREGAHAVFALALELGGSVSGEHGVGSLKRDFVSRQLDPSLLELQRNIKRTIDPKGLLNPGKKL